MTAKKQIAILGGGVAAMATAWQITSEPGWQDRYEITVHQMGWRLGGKGASGRRAPHWRIEEHGLHIWLGFYHNAFKALQEAFTDLNPQAGPAPVGNTPPRIEGGVFLRCEDAFLPHGHVGVYQEWKGQPAPWMVDFPGNDQKPWEGGALPSVWSYIEELVGFLLGQAQGAEAQRVFASEDRAHHQGLLDWLEAEAGEAERDLEAVALSAGFALLALLAERVKALPEPAPGSNTRAHHALAGLLGKLQTWLAHELGARSDRDLASLRLLLVIDMGVAILCGLIRCEVFDGEKLGQLDDEFRSWLKESGALPVTCSLLTNPMLRGVYDFVFAFDGGDAQSLDKTANFATAPALRTIFRMCFTYSGQIFWKMRAGMGDTIFTPLYKALEKRGVRFEFFHKVQALTLSADGRSIARIEMAQQVTTRAPYQPLVDVKGLACWPSLALYEQIEQGDALRAAEEKQGLNLESAWFDWPDASRFTLEQGRDFDQVVFGISLGSVPLLCPELCAASPAWQRMVEKVSTVCTMGLQMWMKPDLQALGWPHGSAIIDAFHEPLDTWADMSHLLPMEVWEAGAAQAPPANVAYFCGALKEGPFNLADKETPYRAALALQAAKADLQARQLRDLWPAAVNRRGQLDPTLVVDSYERVNVDPSERYVMSVAHSSSARLKANASGFDNLTLTGDWIDNGFNAGCVEASVMAGMQAGNAVLGRPLDQGVIGMELG